MAKKKTDDEIVQPEEPQESASTAPETPAPIAETIPALEAYIRQHDETVRGLATVRLEGGGNGDGTYHVDHPVPRIIGHNGSRYAISREDGGVSVYIWANP